MNSTKKLIFVMGPTAVGKTKEAIRLANEFSTEILSFDSRQFYNELNIGVARPSQEELASARHHFIACRSVTAPYDIFHFEQDALSLLQLLFCHSDTAIAVGGSGLYAEALAQGVAIMPDPPIQLRQELSMLLKTQGVAPLQQKLKELDPVYYDRVDKQNGVRLQRALEVCLSTGRPYSQVIQDSRKPRSFQIEYRIVTTPLDNLRNRIDMRVDMMMEQGLLDEVQALVGFRHLNTLNTVGYKELFAYLDGQVTLADAVQQIKWHTWQYAKKQLTWLKSRVPNPILIESN